jgi:hypothetical protein
MWTMWKAICNKSWWFKKAKRSDSWLLIAFQRRDKGTRFKNKRAWIKIWPINRRKKWKFFREAKIRKSKAKKRKLRVLKNKRGD